MVHISEREQFIGDYARRGTRAEQPSALTERLHARFMNHFFALLVYNKLRKSGWSVKECFDFLAMGKDPETEKLHSVREEMGIPKMVPLGGYSCIY